MIMAKTFVMIFILKSITFAAAPIEKVNLNICIGAGPLKLQSSP